MAKYVRIQSTMNITVTPGLQYQDVTNKQAQVPDRLKINPLWAKSSVDIKIGAHWYPVEIVEWQTVKALVKDGVLTIGEMSDDSVEEGVEEESERLARTLKEMQAKQSKPRKNLKELAEETDG